jgi:RNA polymerase sigma-70 factor (ECF subfamily)
MDTDLVRRAQGGDQEAFADLVHALADRFLAVSHRILSDIDLAEDATQQALLSVWQDLPKLRDLARFEAWSYRLLVRACYAEGRKSRRWAPNLRLLSVDEPMVVDGLSAVVDRDQLERAFRSLSLNHRTVVVLHHYLDLPLDRVADIVGAPLGTVGSRLHYATGQLRAAIADAQPTTRRWRNEPTSTPDGDVTRAIRSWLHEDRREDASRIAAAVLDRVEATPRRRPVGGRRGGHKP